MVQTASWVFAATLSAILFGIGDFFVVRTEQKADVLTVFAAYSFLIGLGSLMVLINQKGSVQSLLSNVGLGTLALIAVLHFFAYLFHFYAIQQATNPGYANALVMFHVVVLAGLSWWFLGKPLSAIGVFGVLLMFAGAYVIVKESPA